MPIEMLVGLEVIDDQIYQTYRSKMKPILADHGGGFGVDFKVSEVLQSPTDDPINRVFTIHFPDPAKLEAFFSNAAYLRIKEQYFDRSVATTSILARYEN